MNRYGLLVEALAPWKFIIDIAAAACAFVAAVCWLRASLVKMPKELRHLFHMTRQGPFEGDVADIFKGVLEQSRWNAYAAMFAAVAAILTGISVLIGTRWK